MSKNKNNKKQKTKNKKQKKDDVTPRGGCRNMGISQNVTLVNHT
jgi:hypothetical protein